jgi:hypothetical protein
MLQWQASFSPLARLILTLFSHDVWFTNCSNECSWNAINAGHVKAWNEAIVIHLIVTHLLRLKKTTELSVRIVDNMAEIRSDNRPSTCLVHYCYINLPRNFCELFGYKKKRRKVLSNVWMCRTFCNLLTDSVQLRTTHLHHFCWSVLEWFTLAHFICRFTNTFFGVSCEIFTSRMECSYNLQTRKKASDTS